MVFWIELNYSEKWNVHWRAFCVTTYLTYHKAPALRRRGHGGLSKWLACLVLTRSLHRRLVYLAIYPWQNCFISHLTSVSQKQPLLVTFLPLYFASCCSQLKKCFLFTNDNGHPCYYYYEFLLHPQFVHLTDFFSSAIVRLLDVKEDWIRKGLIYSHFVPSFACFFNTDSTRFYT